MRIAAVLPARGIGDALLMMIAAHALRDLYDRVILYHNSALTLSSWFPEFDLRPLADFVPQEHDLILIENDNSAQIRSLLLEQRERLVVFYPSYQAHKHAPLGPRDRVFEAALPMASNIARALVSVFQTPLTLSNGITPPEQWVHRRYPKRILLHPTSSQSQKNWGISRFVSLGKRLEKQGFSVVCVVSPQEMVSMAPVDLPLIVPGSLAELAALIYESAAVVGNDSLAGHLASNLSVPAWIIADDPERLALWRPGWYRAEVLCPSRAIPRFVRKRVWQRLVRVGRVIASMQTLRAMLPHSEVSL